MIHKTLAPSLFYFFSCFFCPWLWAQTPAQIRVESEYKTYLQHFKKTHQQVRIIIKQEAPELLPRLSEKTPEPVPYGFQILPPLIPGRKPAIYNEDLLSRYSWPITEKYIQWEESMVNDVEQKINFLPKMKPEDRRPILGQIVTDLPRMEKNQQLIDHHIQHNQFWQKAIAEDRPRFDAINVLAKAAEELQQIRKTNKPSHERTQLNPREQELARTIQKQTDFLSGKPVFKIETRPAQNSKFATVIVRVPLYTDIDDKIFLNRFKAIVERVWKIRSQTTFYQVKLDLKTLKHEPTKLPSKGEHIHLESHLKHFPAESAVITTGSNSTYAIPSRAIVLGPQALYEQTLAHEFGHILGFVDTYFRGYKDLGHDGFEIIEVVPDATDIMSMPNAGTAQLHHFETLVLAANSMRSKTHTSETLPPPWAQTIKSIDPGKKVK